MVSSKGNEARAIREQWTNGGKSGNQNRTVRHNKGKDSGREDK